MSTSNSKYLHLKEAIQMNVQLFGLISKYSSMIEWLENSPVIL